MVIGLIGHSRGQLDSSYHVYPHLAIYILDNLSVAIRLFILCRESDEKSFRYVKNVAALSCCNKVLCLLKIV